MVESVPANDRYFTLAEDGAPKGCDFETWINDWPNREKTRSKIDCSPEIEAMICFVGCAPSMIHLDEDVKLWNAQFYMSAKKEIYGGTVFTNFEEAKAFVDRYIAKGCPPSGVPFMLFLSEYNSDARSG